MKKLLLPLLFSVISLSLILGNQEAYAASVTSVGTGDWSAPSTWDTGVPALGDDVTILNGHIVTITDFRTISGSITVAAGGTLVIDGTSDGVLTVTGTLTNQGKIIINGGSSTNDGELNVAMATNNGEIEINGGTGNGSGRLDVISGGFLVNNNLITLNGSPIDSGIFDTVLNASTGTITNNDTIIVNGGASNFSAVIGVAVGGQFINECTGKITLNGGDGNASGRISNQNIFINRGIIELIPGSGTGSGTTISGTIIDETDQCVVVGGTLLPLDTTVLLLAGAQSFSWMIPVVISAIGIGIVIARKF